MLFRMRLLRKNPLATGEQDEANRSNEDDGSFEVTPLMVIVFVVLICGTLLLLYFFLHFLIASESCKDLGFPFATSSLFRS